MGMEEDCRQEVKACISEWHQDVITWSFEVFGSKTLVEEEIVFEEEDDEVEISGEKADC